jgi:hypothetical protein
MDKFQLPFNLHACDHIDHFALLATQDYNLGSRGNWLYYFRSGFQGLHARIYGVALHYYEVHSWRSGIRTRQETEYHISSIFFNMDSAIECFVFALNAFGNAIALPDFLDITADRTLRQVAPWNILGNKRRAALSGYGNYFPKLQGYWQTKRRLLDTITDQHDVSKHRSRIFAGGSVRKDPPPGFYEALGIPDDPRLRSQFQPMAEIILEPDPKGPMDKRKRVPYEQITKLEDIADQFCTFVNTSCVKALEDTAENVKLPHSTFLNLTNVSIIAHPNVVLYSDEECAKRREDVVGVIIASGTEEYGIKHKHIRPTTRVSYYEKGRRVSTEWNLENTWGATWYVDPDSGEKKKAWDSSGEFVGELGEQ